MRLRIAQFGSPFGILSLLLIACQPAVQDTQSPVQSAASSLSSDDPAMAQTIPDHHAQIIALVEAGDEALAGRDADGLLQIAEKLQIMGASPIGGADDLAQRWVIEAHDLTPESDRNAMPFRGRVKGPAYRRQTLGPGEQDVIEDIFYAAEPAEMTLKRLEGDILQWAIVEDGTDNPPVCEGDVGAVPTVCRFLPLWTSKYRIRIANLSDQDTTYLFVTN